MRIPLAKRLTITLFNIFFPPLAVGLLTGFTSKDTLLNSCLFLLAIIPSHIHGFYISATYFARKRRVRKGEWPGKSHKPGVWSEKVLTGGVGWEGARALRRKNGLGNGYLVGEEMVEENGLDRRVSGRSRSRSRSQNRRGERERLRTSQRVSGYGNGNGNVSRRSIRRVSNRPRSGGQQPLTPVSPTEQVHTQPPMQEAGRVVSTGTQRSRNSRRYEGGGMYEMP